MAAAPAMSPAYVRLLKVNMEQRKRSDVSTPRKCRWQRCRRKGRPGHIYSVARLVPLHSPSRTLSKSGHFEIATGDCGPV
jgi:hypothetical protein